MGCIRPDAMGMGGNGLFTQGRALGGFGVKPCCLLTPPVVAGRSWVSTRASTSSAPGTRPRSSGRRGCCPSASACPPGWLTATTATSPTACSSSEPPKPCPAAPPPPEPSLELGAAGSCRGRRVLGVSDGGSPPPRAACDPTVSRRTGEAWRSDRLTLNKEVLSPRVVEGFVPLLSEVGEDFVRRARAQVQKSGRERWTADFSHELFRFALECEPPPDLSKTHGGRVVQCALPCCILRALLPQRITFLGLSSLPLSSKPPGSSILPAPTLPGSP